MQRRHATLVVMCVGYFLVLLDVTIVNVALPSIGRATHAGVSGLQWVVDGYTVALAALMLGAGGAGDLFGHRRVVMLGMSLFGLASAGCGLAPGAGWLIGFRALQGVGAALMLPGTLAVISHAFPERAEQARAIGLWAAVGSVALPAGPLIGGALVQGLGWRWVFLVPVPIVLIATALSARIVPRDGPGAGAGRLDIGGTALAAGTLALITVAFVSAGRDGLSPLVGVAIALAVAGAAGFVVWERSRPAPLLELALFRRPAFTTANGLAGLMNLVTLGLLFVTTLFLQDVQHRSALAAGVALLPLFLPLSVLAPFGGRLTASVGAHRVAASGLALAAAGLALLGVLGARAGYGLLLVAFLLWGGGLALMTPALVSAALRAVPAERAGVASATNNTARQAAGAIGVAAFGALAGTPGTAGFMGGLHAGALTGASLYAAAALVALRGLSPAAAGGSRHETRPMGG